VETEGGRYNRTFAADFALAPHPAISAVGFLAKTQTEGLTGGDMGGYGNLTWLDQNWRIFAEYADFQDDFNPEVGYLPRNGIRTSKIHLEHTPRPGILGIRDMSPMWNVTYTTDQQNRLVSRRLHHMVGTRFNNGANLTVWYNAYFERLDNPFSFNGVPVAAGDYWFGEWYVNFSSNQARRMYYRLSYSPQEFYDGTRTDYSASVGARLNDQLSTEASYSRNEVDLTAGDFNLDLASLRVDFALSPTMTLRAISQYNASRDQSPSGFDPNWRFGTSARFRYTYRPGSDIYVVYDDLRRDAQGTPLYKERRLILKFTHLLSL
jgi:hypothetical protein